MELWLAQIKLIDLELAPSDLGLAPTQKKIIDLRLAPLHRNKVRFRVRVRARFGLGLETLPPEPPQSAPNESSYTTKNFPSAKDKQVNFIQ